MASRLVHITTEDISLRYLLLPQLEAFAAAGYEVIGMSAAGPNRDALAAAGIDHVALANATRRSDLRADARLLVELVRVLRRLRPDVVHTHNPKTGAIGRVAARLAGVPAVVGTVHGIYAIPDDPWPKRTVAYAIEVVAAAFAHRVFVINTDDLATLRRLRVRPSKLRLLRQGVPIDSFDPDRFSAEERRRIRTELVGDPDRIVIGAISRLVWEKGLGELFHAVEQVRLRHPEAVLVVAGAVDPAKPDSLTDADVAAAEAKGVVLLGHRDDVDRLYAAFDLYVLASYREGFPRSAMEAAVMGLPIVTTTVRGCRDVVRPGSTGLVVPPRDAVALEGALEHLVADDGVRAAYAAQARRWARPAFDEARTASETLDQYRELGAGTASPRHGTAVRVLHLCETDQRRGAETFAVDLCAELEAYDLPGTVLALRPGDGANRLPVPVVGRHRFDPRGLLAVRAAMARADVTVCHGASTLLIARAASSGRRRRLVYLSIGDHAYWAVRSRHPARLARRLRAADRVVYLWAGARTAAIERFGLDPEAAVTITNGRPLDRFTPTTPQERSDARARLGLGAEPVVAFVGALSWEKRVDRVVGAIARWPEAQLVVAGAGPCETELRRLADRLTPGRTRFLGSVADPLDVYRAADLVVLASSTEGVPGCVIEAGATGLPAVVPAVGGLGSLVTDGRTGVVLDEDPSPAALAEGLRRAYAERAALGRAAAERMGADHDLAVVGGRWATLLRSLVPQRR